MANTLRLSCPPWTESTTTTHRRNNTCIGYIHHHTYHQQQGRVSGDEYHPITVIMRRRHDTTTTLACKANHQAMYHQTHDEPTRSFGYLCNFDDTYSLGDLIGSGTFGKVYKAVERSTGQEFAVKRMPKRFGPGGMLDAYYVRRIRNEVDIGNHLGRSLNIAYVYQVFEDDDKVDIVMELCRGGTLWDAIICPDPENTYEYTQDDVCRLVRDILRVVALCHSQGVMIRDIKPDNFLFATRDHAHAPLKAIDFGVSVFCEEDERVDMRAGTPMYISPEVLRCDYGLKSDVWSAGMVAYLVLTGKLPFCGDEGEEIANDFMHGVACANKDIFRAVLYSELDFSQETWKDLPSGAKDLVQKMLQRDADDRPSAAECLQHEWIVSLDEQQCRKQDTVVQRLQRFGTYGLLKQTALRKMAHVATHLNLSHALEQGMEDLGISALPDGRITKADLEHVLVQGGQFDLSPLEAEQLMAQVTCDQDDAIDPLDWCAAMTEWKAIRDTGEWEQLLSEVFASADVDNDDALGAGDVERLLCGEEGCEVSDMIDAAIREADSDGDGALSFGDFKAFLSNHESELDFFDDRLLRDE
jgi:calcium-dependent protein kinase